MQIYAACRAGDDRSGHIVGSVSFCAPLPSLLSARAVGSYPPDDMQVLLSDFIEVEIKIRDRSNVTVVSQLDSRVVLGVDGSGALSSRELAGLAVVARPSPGRSRELAGNAIEAGRVQAQLLNQVNAQPERRRPPGA